MTKETKIHDLKDRIVPRLDDAPGPALLGPLGLSEAHFAEKWFRDARIFDIYEGPGEVQRLIIARQLLGYGPRELN